MAAVWWVLVPVSAGFLVLAHALAFRTGLQGRRQRLALWAATPITVLFWLLPYLGR